MKSTLLRLLANPTGRIGLVLVVLVLLAAALAPLIAPYPPSGLDVRNRFSGPSLLHLFGTDHLGRDIASRLLYGTRIAVMVAVSSIALALTAGTLLGILADYLPPRLERIILIVFDIISSFPSLVLALAVVALFGPGLWKIVLIASVTLVPHFGRVARAQTLSLKNSPFLEAERVLGASWPRMVAVHIAPHDLAQPLKAGFVQMLDFAGRKIRCRREILPYVRYRHRRVPPGIYTTRVWVLPCRWRRGRGTMRSMVEGANTRAASGIRPSTAEAQGRPRKFHLIGTGERP